MAEFVAGALASLPLEIIFLRLGVPRLLNERQARSHDRVGLMFRLPLLALAVLQQQPWWIGFWTAGTVVYLWFWWNSDDNEDRRRRLRARARQFYDGLAFDPAARPAPA